MCNSELGRVRQASEEEPTRCVFCEIVSGKSERSIVAETSSSISFISLEGHPLVLPKKHIGDDPNSEDDLQMLKETFGLAIALVPTVRRVYGATGVNILLNLGRDAGQKVMHAHFHVIPRTLGDRKIRASLAEPLPREELDRLAEVLAYEFRH